MTTEMNKPEAAQPLPRNFAAQFFRGALYPFQAFGFLRRHRLWGMASAAIIVNCALLALLVGGAFYFLIPYLEATVVAMVAWAGDSTLWMGVIEALTWVLWIVAIPAIIIMNFMVLILVGQAVASPFLDLLSEQVEVRVLEVAPAPFGVKRTLKSVAIALGDLVWGVLFLVAVNLPLLLLAFIPVLGTSLAGVLSFSFSALLLAHEFMGLPLARQLVPYRRRWSHVWKHKWLGLGMGTSTMLLLAVPGLNLVLLPLAAVGGTLMYCDLRADGRV